MEIPNYDSSDDTDKKFKQLYPNMPSDTFRMLVILYTVIITQLNRRFSHVPNLIREVTALR